MAHTSTKSFSVLMEEGHRALQSERNQEALDLFKQALYVTDGSDQQNCEATHMQAITKRKLGNFPAAISDFFLANTFATTALESGRIHRDLGMAYLDAGNYKEARETLETSSQILRMDNEFVEEATTRGFQGRLELKDGNIKAARTLMLSASQRIKHNPVYALNNLIWLMLASPIRRWVLLPQALWLVVRHSENRTVGALVRVLVSMGGMRFYDAARAKKSR